MPACDGLALRSPDVATSSPGLPRPRAQDALDVADREDVKELRHVRAEGELGAFTFVECRHLMDRHVEVVRQSRDDALRVGLRVVGGHGEILGVAAASAG
jgi:hypothetical protein